MESGYTDGQASGVVPYTAALPPDGESASNNVLEAPSYLAATTGKQRAVYLCMCVL